MPGKRLEKCSTCTRVFSLRSSSWASWVNSSWENISRPGKERMKGAVLAVVDLARAFIDLHGQAQVALREQRLQMAARAGQQGVACLLLHGGRAAPAHAQVDVDEALAPIPPPPPAPTPPLAHRPLRPGGPH